MRQALWLPSIEAPLPRSSWPATQPQTRAMVDVKIYLDMFKFNFKHVQFIHIIYCSMQIRRFGAA